MEQRDRQRRAAEGEAAQHSVQLGGGAMWRRRAVGEEAVSEGEAVPRGGGRSRVGGRGRTATP
jgi:hypothetical protein